MQRAEEVELGMWLKGAMSGFIFLLNSEEELVVDHLMAMHSWNL